MAWAVGERDGGVHGGELEVHGEAFGGDAGDGAGDAGRNVDRAVRLGEVAGEGPGQLAFVEAVADGLVGERGGARFELEGGVEKA